MGPTEVPGRCLSINKTTPDSDDKKKREGESTTWANGGMTTNESAVEAQSVTEPAEAHAELSRAGNFTNTISIDLALNTHPANSPVLPSGAFL